MFFLLQYFEFELARQILSSVLSHNLRLARLQIESVDSNGGRPVMWLPLAERLT